MDLTLEAFTKITESSVDMNELNDVFIIEKSLFNKNWLDLSTKEIHLERGLIFKTRKAYCQEQFKILELVKKSTIKMNSDLNDSVGYYLETKYELFARIVGGEKIKVINSSSGDHIEQLAQKIGEVMECRVYHITKVKC